MSLSPRLGLALGGAALIAGCVSKPPPATPASIPAPTAKSLPAGRFIFHGSMTQGGLLIGTAPPGTVSLTLDGVPVPLAKDGRFLIGFGRDAGPASSVDATLGDGQHVREALQIAAREWDIQSLPTLPKGTKPTPEFLLRRKAELEQIAAARALSNDSHGWEQQFFWPVTGRISGRFGSQRIYAGEPGSPHSGVDIARPAGTLVAAPADGVVILAAPSPFTLEGNLLMIDHGMGLNSAFLHLSRIDVRVGQHVVRGQPVGAIGMTGRATGPHLHWSMMVRGVRVDPMLAAGAMPASAETGTDAATSPGDQ